MQNAQYERYKTYGAKKGYFTAGCHSRKAARAGPPALPPPRLPLLPPAGAGLLRSARKSRMYWHMMGGQRLQGRRHRVAATLDTGNVRSLQHMLKALAAGSNRSKRYGSAGQSGVGGQKTLLHPAMHLMRCSQS